MNDPKNPNQEPQRTSNPMPGQTPPMEAPTTPNTEYEKDVPHSPNQPVAMASGGKGEGSYQGTQQYDEGAKKFGQKVSNDEAIKKAKQIDTNDPSLKNAEKIGKSGRTSSTSIH